MLMKPLVEFRFIGWVFTHSAIVKVFFGGLRGQFATRTLCIHAHGVDKIAGFLLAQILGFEGRGSLTRARSTTTSD